jgi:hypothetical protein
VTAIGRGYKRQRKQYGRKGQDEGIDHMRGLILAVALCAAFTAGGMASARADVAWAGVWTSNVAHCKLKNKVGDSDMAPIRLTAKAFDGYENSCSIDAVKQGAFPHTWTVSLSCLSEGEQAKFQKMFILSFDDKDLHMVDETGSVTTFHRCK